MVVFFDIDGTIVDDESQVIPESAIRAVKKLRQNGHIPVINTGRPYAHIDQRVRTMDFAGYICACGMELLIHDTWISRKYPDQTMRRHALAAIRECGMQTKLEPADSALITDGDRSRHPRIVRDVEQMRGRGFSVRDVSEQEELDFIKGITYDWPGCDREQFLRRMEPWFTCILRENTLIEFVLKGCSKAEGMRILLEHLGIPLQDTLAIGDSTNDLPMFQAAEHTVCMGGGMEELKAHAEFITADVMDDGIEKALKHFGLI